MLVRDSLRGIPGARDTAWTRFANVWSRPASDLHRAGAYLVGVFDVLPVDVGLAPLEGDVIYIGETHGPKTNLNDRLRSLAYTIGLVEAGHWTHVAGHAFNRLFSDDEQRRSALSRLAVAPIPFDMCSTYPPDMRGVVPLLMEKQLLVDFLRARGTLPLLNNYERVMPTNWRPMPVEDLLGACVAGALTKEGSGPLGAWLSQACMWRGRSASAVWYEDGSWAGWKVTPKRGLHVFLGRCASDPVLEWSVYKTPGWKALEPVRQIRTAREAAEAVFSFQFGWRTDFAIGRVW